jgi:uncharacterized protein YegL
MRLIITILLFCQSIIYAQANCINFSPIENTTRFLLVVDVSGSMNGQPLDDAKSGLTSFISKMEDSDEAALVTFSDQITIHQSMTDNQDELRRGVRSMRSGGGTHLYDAVAKAIVMSKSYKGNTAIVLLTDGQDGGSHFSAVHIESMVGYHGVAFYGIGLGNVDAKSLRTIATKTGGEFDVTPNSNELKRIYQSTLKVYKKKYRNSTEQTSHLKIHSMPGGRPVTLDGKTLGKTPLKISNISPGDHSISILFDSGPWRCESELPAGMLGQIAASESDVDKNVAILSIPHGCAVFLDDQFQGYTSNFLEKSTTSSKGFIFKKKKTVVDYSRELILENVPKGKHIISIIPFAGSEIEGMFSKVNYPFVMGSKNLIIKTDARSNTAKMETTQNPLKAKSNRFKLDESSIYDDF